MHPSTIAGLRPGRPHGRAAGGDQAGEVGVRRGRSPRHPRTSGLLHVLHFCVRARKVVGISRRIARFFKVPYPPLRPRLPPRLASTLALARVFLLECRP